MPSLTQVICLANSWKRGGRCIAGINPRTGQWVRPVSQLPYGQVSQEMRRIDCREPELLDLLKIPLDKTGENFGFESENRTILPGKWRRVGHISPQNVLPYCSEEEYILHNNERYVALPFLQSLPERDRKTLQLIQAIEFSVRFTGKRFVATLATGRGKTLTAPITDPVYAYRLELGIRPSVPCLVTVSLSMPWQPADWEGEIPCWKLIAAVIELGKW
ncbi:MAG: hypothetical protein SW833_21330 [Cyanobacteriota bacterium]|nr:hypothetical protein [Cyanobacteriota bacterium]